MTLNSLWTLIQNLWWETPEAIINPQETLVTLSNNKEIILNSSMTVCFYLNVNHLSILKNPQILMCS